MGVARCILHPARIVVGKTHFRRIGVKGDLAFCLSVSPRFFGFTFTADSRTCVRSRRIYTVKSLDRNLLDAWPRTKKRSKTLSISFCRCCQNKRGREKRREGKRREIGSRLGNFFYPPRKL